MLYQSDWVRSVSSTYAFIGARAASSIHHNDPAVLYSHLVMMIHIEVSSFNSYSSEAWLT